MLKRNGYNLGFTLIELMIAMVIASFIAAAILMSFDSQQKTQVNQKLVVEMQQDARAALYLMQQDIRMAGYDETWDDGNTDSVDDNRLSDGQDNDCDASSGGGTDSPADTDEGNDIAGIVQAGPHLIQIRQDENSDGNFCAPGDLITYALADGDTLGDIDPDGVVNATMELRRGILKMTPAPPTIELQPLAASIQAVSFGYAFDDDSGAATTDGRIDTDAGGNIIWAYDSDNDGNLDTLLDRNNDGVVDGVDDSNSDGRINNFDAVSTPLPALVPVNRIKAVRIWILARTRAPLRGHQYTQTYVVGDKIIATADDYERVLLATTVNCRNLGLR